MRRHILRTLTVGFCLSLAVLIGCSVSVGGGGRSVTFTIAGKSFTITLSEAFEPFEVTAGAAEPVRQAALIPLFDETPSDVPAGATITVDPNRIQAIPLGVGKGRVEAQTISGTATMTVYIDGADSTNPCTDGTNIGTITLTIADGGVTLDRLELDVFGDALAHLLSGTFSICVELAADINVRITIEEMVCIFGPAVDEPIDNTNDNASGTGNENDNVNTNGNTSGTDNENDNVGGGDVVQVTTDPGNEIDPQWDPASETIAFQTDRAPAGTSVRNIGSVQADGSGEGNMAVGPNSGFGVGGPMFWVGTTGLLIVNERVVFHEYMSFDTSQAPFTRTVDDGDDEAFTRELFITGGGGGDFINVSRDGSTVLWRFSTDGGSGTAQLRTAPFSSLTGQDADAVGTVQFQDVDPVVQTLKNGAALGPGGSQVVVSLPSGDGFDLFLYDIADPAVLVRQLTSSGSSAGVNNALPDISPDGTQVAFARTAPGEDTDLYRVEMDGTGLTQLTFTDRSESEPSWSPGGGRIAFQRADDDGWNIYVLTLNGGVPVDECGSDADCPSGQTCVDGNCVPVTPGCTSNLDCGSDETCVDGTCVPAPGEDGFTTATIIRRGAEHLIAGPDADPNLSLQTPAGYAPGPFGTKSVALSGDGGKVWVALYDQFPNVEGDPQTQLWSVNTDGTGGTRSSLPVEDIRNGMHVATNIDGSVVVTENPQTTTFYRATPGTGVSVLYNYADLEGIGDSRGILRLSDDASRLIYVSFTLRNMVVVDLSGGSAAPQVLTTTASLITNGIAGTDMIFELDGTSSADRWIAGTRTFDPDPFRNRWPIFVGDGVSSPAISLVATERDDLAFNRFNMTDDGQTIAYCRETEFNGLIGRCYIQTVGSAARTEIVDEVENLGNLSLSDDGSKAYMSTGVGHGGGQGFIYDVASGERYTGGSQWFSDTPSPDFTSVEWSDDGRLLMSAISRGIYVLHDGSVPAGFPTIDRILYRMNDEDCSMTVRVEVDAPLGIERIFTLPFYQGLEASRGVIPGTENPLFRERSGGGVNKSTTFTQLETGVWERQVFLTNDVGECASSFLSSDFSIRVVLVEATTTRTVFQDFSPVPGGGDGGEADCFSNDACNTECGDTDPDCALCGADGVCMVGCPGIDPDCTCADCPGECFDNVCFAQGAISYADVVLRYDPEAGGGPTPEAAFADPSQALGPPNFVSDNDGTFASLSQGGVLELGFTDNVLTNSGDTQTDLRVFEVGTAVEATFVAIRATSTTQGLLAAQSIFPSGDWFEIGRIEGSTRNIDIDQFFPGFSPGALEFDAVQLIDDPNDGPHSLPTPGADIDAVGAIATRPL